MFVLEALKAYAKTDRTAYINREEYLSFSRLDAASEAFAAWLLEQFGDDRTPIVIYGEKESGFLPCVYGALKSGRGYVPVDTVVPPGRAAEILAEVAPKVVINLSNRKIQTNALVLNAVTLEEILRSPKAEVSQSFWISGGVPAYILFTSGSTGKPKGVPITADNLKNFYQGLLPYLDEGGVILNQISYSFDVSGCSIYAGLSRGMILFSVDRAMVENIGILFAWLQNANLTVWVSTPSVAEICVQSEAFCEKLLPRLRKFLFCGEVLTHKLCDQLAQRFPQAEIINTYGPTEATVLVTAVSVAEKHRLDERPIPIGVPLNGVRLRLADQLGGTIEKDEEPGELLILSDSVSPGYLARPELTKQRFFFDEKTGKRGYRTGDLCYRKNGLYYYCGRMDNQLKLNGFRIELEDVESNLAKLENISRAAVVPVWEGDRVLYLAAFLLLEHPDGISSLQRTIKIKKQAAEVLPAYMIPRKLYFVKKFPLNTNGKINKKALEKQLWEVARK